MSEWISVKDRLPQMEANEYGEAISVTVLLWFGTHAESGVLVRDDMGLRHAFFDGDSLLREPTHWMPLPEPPEADNGQDA